MSSVVRSTCVVAFIVAIARVWAEDPPPAKGLLNIEGTAFIEAAKNASYTLYSGSDSPYTAEELIAIATKLADDVKSVPDSPKHYLSPFGNFFEAACERANDSQADQLIQIYLRLNPASFEKMEYLPPLAAAWIHRELKNIHGKKAGLAPFDATPPHALTDAPKDLLEVWRFYKGCMAPYEKTYPDGSSKEQMSYELNLHGFFRLVDAVLVWARHGFRENVASVHKNRRELLGYARFRGQSIDCHAYDPSPRKAR